MAASIIMTSPQDGIFLLDLKQVVNLQLPLKGVWYVISLINITMWDSSS